MRVILPVLLSFLLAGSAAAQRGGGGGGGSHGGGGGGFHGGGMSGGGFHGGGFGGGGGFRGGGFTGGGFRGGVGGFRGGAFDRDGFGRFGFRGGFGVGFYGGYWPSYYPFWDGGYAYDWPGYNQYPDYGYAAPAYYGGYAASPNVTVVYPSNASAPVYERPTPVTHEYDQYGQEIHQSGGASGNASPIYLVAFKDHSIAAAAAYWVDGRTLHYVNLQHEEKQASLDTVDRDFSLQLNRERHIPFQVPQ